jgi:hypothetical protein
MSAQPIAFFAGSTRACALRWVLFTGMVLAIAGLPHTAEARRGIGVPGAYDGVWNVVFATRAGNCSSTNSVPFSVSGNHVSSAGGGKVTGGISPRGIVAVSISVGASRASGSGRLVGNSGTGRWSGIISGDRCSGSWLASRG